MPCNLSLCLFCTQGLEQKMDQDMCMLDTLVLKSYRGFIGKLFSSGSFFFKIDFI